MKKDLGEELGTKIEKAALAIYKKCYEHAYKNGIIIADTKFEFGLDENGEPKNCIGKKRQSALLKSSASEMKNLEDWQKNRIGMKTQQTLRIKQKHPKPVFYQ